MPEDRLLQNSNDVLAVLREVADELKAIARILSERELAQRGSPEAYVREKELQQILGVSADALRKFRERQDDEDPIPFGLAGRAIQYRIQDVHAWLIREAERKRLKHDDRLNRRAARRVAQGRRSKM